MQPTFHEIQRFNKWWHYLIIGVPVLLMIGLPLLIYVDIAPGVVASGSWSLLASGTVILSALLTFFWFLYLKLETRIDAQGIVVRFHGIPFCKRTIVWQEIKTISLMTYSPLSDYGGWGVRYGMAGNGWCYNVSGGKGIKLFYQNGKPFLIGTQQEEAAKKVIEHYFKS
jgi:hypothetical protein